MTRSVVSSARPGARPCRRRPWLEVVLRTLRRARDKAALIQAMSDYQPSSGNGGPGSGATLPTSGPMPPNRPQMLASAIMGQGGAGLPATGPMPPAPPAPPAAQPVGLNPDAPAPNAVPTGPAPVPVQPGPAPMASAAAPMPSALQPLGLAGDGGGDPSSARNFLLAEAMRNQGAPAAQRDPRDYLPAMGVAPTAAAPSGGQAAAAPEPADRPQRHRRAGWEPVLRHPDPRQHPRRRAAGRRRSRRFSAGSRWR